MVIQSASFLVDTEYNSEDGSIILDLKSKDLFLLLINKINILNSRDY